MSFCSLAHNSPPGQMPVLTLINIDCDQDGVAARTLRDDRESSLRDITRSAQRKSPRDRKG
jgi:hypothetical protein